MARTITIKKMAIVSLMTAILCILSPVSIPIFISPVPVSLGVLAIYLTAYVLEPVESLVSVVLFLLLGIFGLPVFSGYSGGVAKIPCRIFIYSIYKLILYSFKEGHYLWHLRNDTRSCTLLSSRHYMVFVPARQGIFSIIIIMRGSFLIGRCH